MLQNITYSLEPNCVLIMLHKLSSQLTIINRYHLMVHKKIRISGLLRQGLRCDKNLMYLIFLVAQRINIVLTSIPFWYDHDSFALISDFVVLLYSFYFVSVFLTSVSLVEYMRNLNSPRQIHLESIVLWLILRKFVGETYSSVALSLNMLEKDRRKKQKWVWMNGP